MIIPVKVKLPSDDDRKLPPQLADLGNGNLALIELQGTLEVQGSADSLTVGTLEIDPKTVCVPPATSAGPGILTRARSVL